MDGETVLGCYKIERKIGEGFVVHSCFSCSGFSEVYLATDLKSQEELKKCSSDYIVRYFDAKEDKENFWVDQQGLH